MSSALNWHNRIYTNIEAAVGEKCKNVSRATGNAVPSQYPAVIIQLLNAPETQRLR